MRYAIISDLHANLQAFEAVLTDLSAQKADRVICLGDAIGYGPQPAEVLSLVHAHVHEMLMGNHEAAAAGLMDTEDFSAGAKASLASTKKKLNRAAIDYIRGLPYEIESPAFRCTHADFSDPQSFGYVETAKDAERCFAACEEPLLFLGHTHEPAVFVLRPDGGCERREAADFTLEFGHRYLVNPGSVGMPRTEDPRATYCLYDTQTNRLCFHRTSYGVREFRRLVEADAKDSEQLAYVLSLLDDHALPVLHEQTDFAARSKVASRTTSRPAVHAPATRPTQTSPRRADPTERSHVLPITVALVLLVALGAGFAFRRGAQNQHHKMDAVAEAPPPAAPAAEATGVRLVLDGKADKIPITLLSNSRGASANLSDAKDVLTRTCVAIYNMPATNSTWQKSEWVFQPEGSGEIELRLEGRRTSAGLPLFVLYDDLALEGATLEAADFEAAEAAGKAWGLGADAGKAVLLSDPKLAHDGSFCLKASNKAPASQRIKVKAKTEVKLTFWYRMPPPDARS